MRNDPTGAEPDSKAQSQAEKKISQVKKAHRQVHGQISKHYYDITHAALCWLWQRRPDAHQILALATIVLVVIGYWTLVDIEVTLERSERAWVGPTDVKIDAAPQEDKDVKITVSVRNTGKEPAIDFFWDIDPFIVHKSEFANAASEKAMSDYVDRCFLRESRRRQQVVYPTAGLGSGFDFTATIEKILIDDNVINGDDVILVRGCLVYRTFAKPRHSAVCYFFKAKVTDPNHLNICVGGSDAD
jgi:hypothetical protein